jgi:hypothetical protein
MTPMRALHLLFNHPSNPISPMQYSPPTYACHFHILLYYYTHAHEMFFWFGSSLCSDKNIGFRFGPGFGSRKNRFSVLFQSGSPVLYTFFSILDCEMIHERPLLLYNTLSIIQYQSLKAIYLNFRRRSSASPRPRYIPYPHMWSTLDGTIQLWGEST